MVWRGSRTFGDSIFTFGLNFACESFATRSKLFNSTIIQSVEQL